MTVLHRQPVGQLHTHGSGPLEAKVTVPTITTAALVSVIGALYGVLDVFWLDLSDDEEKALAVLGLALLPVVQFVVGYFTRHTARPDVPHPPAPADQPDLEGA